MSAPHLNSRDITHRLVLPHQWRGTVSTAADTDRHTHLSSTLPTDSHSLPAVHTTTAHNHSHPCPLGKAFRGRDGRDGLPGPPGPPGPPGIPGAAGTPGVAAIDLRYVQPPTTDTPIIVTPPTKPPPPPPPPPPPVTTVGGGVTYIRWGRTSCPKVNGTEDIYNGVTAGSHHTNTGGGSNYICIVKEPRYHPGALVRGSGSYIYGTEYQTRGDYLNSLHDDNVPCAACHVTNRSAQLMIPGTDQCPGGWTSEYRGWLMSARHDNKGRTMFVCIDKDAQALPGLGADSDVAQLYHTSVDCTLGIPCPPYVHAKHLACVVCTK